MTEKWDQLITTDEAAKYLRISLTTLARWRMAKHRHGPPYYKLGAMVVYKEKELNDWVESQRVK